MDKVFQHFDICFGSNLESMCCQSFFLLALLTKLLHYLAFLDYSYLFFLISDVNTEAENDAKMATFLSEIFTLVRKTTASQPNTQTGIFC